MIDFKFTKVGINNGNGPIKLKSKFEIDGNSRLKDAVVTRKAATLWVNCS